MKIITTTLAFLFMSAAAMSQSQRLVFIEEFTQASCGPCASANPSFNALLSNNTTKAVSVKYQTSWPGTDPMNAQNPTQVATRVSYYGVSGVPNAIMGGNVVNGAPSAITQSGIDNRYNTPSPFSMQLSHWLNAAQDSIFIHCEVTASQATSLTTGRLHVAMVEKTISFSSPPGSTNEKVFYNVMRKMYPSAGGTALASSWTNGQKKAVSFKAAIPSYIYQLNEIAIVAWIQDDSNKEVKQSAFSATAGTPSALPPIADLSSDANSDCDGTVRFKDESALFPSSWLWDFGDGSSSTQQHPVHFYKSSGTYSVSLTAANGNGSNQITKSNQVTVTLNGTAPVGTGTTICGPAPVNLSATGGSGTLGWFDENGNSVGTGNSITPNVNGTTNFYVAEMTSFPAGSVGEPDNTMGGGDYFTANNVHGLYFDVAKSCTLQSVVVFSNLAGNRTIEVLDGGGTVIHSVVKNIPNGQSTVQLDLPFAPGSGYLIKIASTTVNLYRNSAGGSFPYPSGVITITGNTATNNPGYYYFFYDWQVKQNDCSSPYTTITVVDSCSLTGVNEPESVKDVQVFPNPNHGIFTTSFEVDQATDVEVSITNTIGQTIVKDQMKNFSGIYNKEFDLTTAGKGVYLLSVSSGGSPLIRRIITY